MKAEAYETARENKRANKIIVATAAFVLVGITFSVIYYIFLDSNHVLSRCKSDYRFINPEPDCEVYLDKLSKYNELQHVLENKILELKDANYADRVAVFSRDLKTQRFVGVNENDRFFMASLLKTPIMIAWLKIAEVEPGVLKTTLKYTGEPNRYSEQRVVPKEKLHIGKIYTIEELIEHAIIYSDNTAAQILFDDLPKGFIDNIMRALTIQLESENGVYENFITAKTYASVFRSLYNSSYLTREYADKALEILSRSEFGNGTRKVLPNNVVLASKFGERQYRNSNNEIKTQLHECGIVYAREGQEPYTFCILTEGNNSDHLQKIIQDISRIIYEYLS